MNSFATLVATNGANEGHNLAEKVASRDLKASFANQHVCVFTEPAAGHKANLHKSASLCSCPSSGALFYLCLCPFQTHFRAPTKYGRTVNTEDRAEAPLDTPPGSQK